MKRLLIIIIFLSAVLSAQDHLHDNEHIHRHDRENHQHKHKHDDDDHKHGKDHHADDDDHKEEDTLEEKIDFAAFLKGFVSDDAKTRKENLLKAKKLTKKNRQILIKLLEKEKDPELKFITNELRKAGEQTTASGLKYTILRIGKGKSPGATSKVEVHYKGMLLNGKIFDSSYKRKKTITFALNQVIKGWTEGLQLMKEGAKYKFIIPPKLAYGKQGSTGDGYNSIPANSTLVFIVELIKVD